MNFGDVALGAVRLPFNYVSQARGLVIQHTGLTATSFYSGSLHTLRAMATNLANFAFTQRDIVRYGLHFTGNYIVIGGKLVLLSLFVGVVLGGVIGIASGLTHVLPFTPAVRAMAIIARGPVDVVNTLVELVADRVEAVLVAPRALGEPRPKPWRDVARDRPTLFRKYFADWVRATFDTGVNSVAQRRVVKQALQRELEEHGVRPSHIAAHVDVIVAMAFIPSCYAVEAMLIENSDVAQQARRDAVPVAHWTVWSLIKSRVFGAAPPPSSN